jgi:hypothetical protein
MRAIFLLLCECLRTVIAETEHRFTVSLPFHIYTPLFNVIVTWNIHLIWNNYVVISAAVQLVCLKTILYENKRAHSLPTCCSSHKTKKFNLYIVQTNYNKRITWKGSFTNMFWKSWNFALLQAPPLARDCFNGSLSLQMTHLPLNNN